MQIVAYWGSGNTPRIQVVPEMAVAAFEEGWNAFGDAFGGQPSGIGYTVWPRDRGKWEVVPEGEEGNSAYCPPGFVRDAIRAAASDCGLLPDDGVL